MALMNLISTEWTSPLHISVCQEPFTLLAVGLLNMVLCYEPPFLQPPEDILSNPKAAM